VTGCVIDLNYTITMEEFMNSDVIEQLKQRFGATIEEERIDQEDLDYLRKRDEIEDVYSWHFNAFVKHYQLIKDYGLKEKLLNDLAWRIKHHLENHEIDELKKSEFYKQFGTHKIIEDAINEVGLT